MSIDSEDEYKPTTAIEWLVALSDRPADSRLHAEFDRWLALDARNAEEWADVNRMDDLIRRNGAAKITSISHQPRRLKIAAMAAAAVIALIFSPTIALRMKADFSASGSALAAAPLTDGTKVYLAPSSSISVNYSSGERRVNLLKGEAFFEVVPDSSRPFRVSAAAAQVTVLGTAFEIRDRNNTSTVAVREGQVQVDPLSANSKPMRLGTGDVVRVDASGEMEKSKLPAGQAGAWIHGQLIVRERPVAEVVSEIQRFSSDYFILTGQWLPDMVVTGIYNLNKPVEALEIIAAVHGAKIRTIGRVHFIYK